MSQHTTLNPSVTFEPDPEVERLIGLYAEHRDIAHQLSEMGAHVQAERHREMSVEFLRQARTLALGGQSAAVPEMRSIGRADSEVDDEDS